MKRLLALALALLALPAGGQINVTTAPCKMTDGSCGAPTFTTIPAPSGATANAVGVFLGSPLRLSYLTAGTALQVLRVNAAGTALEFASPGYTYATATDTLTSTGTVAARNLTATALATPVITPPVSPVLSLLTTVTVVAGASLADGDYFTLSDGSAVVYEFDSNATVTGGRVPITFTGAESAQAIRDLVVVAINGSTLEATAIAAAADTLTVTSDTAGDSMGVNSENVANAGFLVPAWSEPTHATTYGYKVVAYAPDGTSTAASAEVTTAAGHATLSGANYNSVTWGNVTGASSYRLYRTTGGAAPPKLIYSGPLLNFADIGAAGTAETPATVNTTGTVTAGRVVAGAGTAATPGFTFSTEATGIYVPSAGTLAFATAGARRAQFNATAFTILGPDFQLTDTSGANPLVFTRPAAATLQLGAAASATPVAQTLQAQGGAGTNIAGQPWVRKGSLGTGTADSGAIIDQTGYTAGATTTAHFPSTRSQLSARWTALTAGADTGFATLTYGASTSVGAEFFVTIRAGDGTNRQAMSYRVAVNSVRDAAGNTQSTVAVIGTPPVAAGSGTLTAAFTVTEGAGAVTINCNAVSSLTETFLDANFQTIANGPGLTIAAL